MLAKAIRRRYATHAGASATNRGPRSTATITESLRDAGAALGFRGDPAMKARQLLGAGLSGTADAMIAEKEMPLVGRQWLDGGGHHYKNVIGSR